MLFHSRLKKIGDSAFSENDLEKITVLSDEVAIGKYAFEKNNSLNLFKVQNANQIMEIKNQINSNAGNKITDEGFYTLTIKDGDHVVFTEQLQIGNPPNSNTNTNINTNNNQFVFFGGISNSGEGFLILSGNTEYVEAGLYGLLDETRVKIN